MTPRTIATAVREQWITALRNAATVFGVLAMTVLFPLIVGLWIAAGCPIGVL